MEPRNPSGSNDPTDTDEQLLAAMEPGEPYGTPELVEKTDNPQSTVNYALNRLADQGRIEKKKLGHRSVAWWIPSNGLEAMDDEPDEEEENDG